MGVSLTLLRAKIHCHWKQLHGAVSHVANTLYAINTPEECEVMFLFF